MIYEIHYAAQALTAHVWTFFVRTIDSVSPETRHVVQRDMCGDLVVSLPGFFQAIFHWAVESSVITTQHVFDRRHAQAMDDGLSMDQGLEVLMLDCCGQVSAG